MNHPVCSLLLPRRRSLQILGEPTGYPNEYWTADSSISAVRPLTFRQFGDEEPANLFVFFCDDAKYFGTVGIAYVGGLCDSLGYQVGSKDNIRNQVHFQKLYWI